MKHDLTFLDSCQRLYTRAQLSSASAPAPGHGLQALTAEDVLWAAGLGAAADDIFYTGLGKTADSMQGAVGKCRFVANDIEELRLIHQAAQPRLQAGFLEPAAVRIVPAAWENGQLPGIPESRLSALAKASRELPALTIRGCFFQGDLSGLHGEALGRYFRSCYELAKRMSTLLPCKISWLGILGGWEAAEQNAAEHPETFATFRREAEIVAAQNRSAFYARLILT